MMVVKTLIVVLLFAYAILAQNIKNDAQLRLDLKLVSKQVCMGKPLVVSALLTNRTEDDIIINTGQIGYSTGFISFISYKDGGIGGEAFHIIGNNSDGRNPKFVVISPNKTYSQELSFILDSEFFRARRSYKMQIGYAQFKPQTYQNQNVWEGQVESNEIKFQIQHCKKINLTKTGRKVAN